MKRVLWLTVLLTLVSTMAMADGPVTGVISGVVTDASGSPIPGVGVTITGNRGDQYVQTGPDGEYRFALLEPGNYTVAAVLEGLGEAASAALVAAGKRSEINLKLAAVTSESITVTSEAPLIDRLNVGVGTTMQAEVGVEVTGEDRTYFGIINFMPGTHNEDENADLAGHRPNINGATWADHNVYIDGVDTTYTRYGGTRVYLPSAAVTEVTVESGALGAEYGRTIGAATNVIVKSGSNKYHGNFGYSRTQESWNSEFKSHPELLDRQFCRGASTDLRLNCDADYFRRTDLEKESDENSFETGLGGPLMRDKAWFFLSANQQKGNRTGKTINGDAVDESGNYESRIVKFNFQAAESHSFAVTYIDTPIVRNFRFEPDFDRYTMTPHDIGGDLYSGSWNYSASSSVFLETKLAFQTSNENKLLAFGGLDIDAALAVKQEDSRFPAGDPAIVGPDYPGNNYSAYLDTDGWHNGWLLDNGYGTNKYPRDQFNVALTHFANADHEFKYGLDAQQVEWTGDVRRPNLYSGQGTNIFSSTAVSGFVDPFSLNPFGVPCDFRFGSSCIINDYNHQVFLDDFGSNDSYSENSAIYVRDRWTMNKWVFNLGVRVAKQKHENDVSRVLMDSTDVSPRLSAAYDVGGDGRKLITFYAGRSFNQLPQEAINQNMMDQFNGYNGYERRLYIDCAFVDCGFGVGAFPFPVGYTFSLGFIRPGLQWDLVDAGVFDSDLEPYHKDEIIAGYEWQFTDNWVFDGKLIWWDVDNLISSTSQLAYFDGNIDVWTLTANTSDIADIMRAVVASAQGQTVLGGLPATDFLADEVGISQYQEPYRDYKAAQLQFNRRFSDGWGLYSNITFAEASGSSHGEVFNNTNDSYGENLEQVLTQADITNCDARQADRTVPVDCAAALTQFLGTPISIINQDGHPAWDRDIVLHATGWKVFQVGSKNSITAGANFSFSTGAKWARAEGAGGTAINPALAGIPQTLESAVPLEAVGSRELPSTWQLNLSGAWDFPIKGVVTGELRFEVQNVTNNQKQTGVGVSQTLGGETNLGEVRPLRRGWQRPRRYRVLFGVNF